MVKVKAPGTCGELVQGTVGGENFLITCPVDVFSEVEVLINQVGRHKAGSKTIAAVEKTFAYLGVSSCNFVVTVNSKLPSGKGMASSSADISAACQAAALCVGKKLTVDEIADIALSVEPTDGIAYPGIVMFDHVNGTVRRLLGQPPAIKVVIFDAGGEVDTLHFNKRQDLVRLNYEKEVKVQIAMEMVTKGLKFGDAGLIGQGATLSAIANQTILPKPYLEGMIGIATNCGAVGVNAAHSGTVIGVLFACDQLEGLEECIARLQQNYPAIKYMDCVNLIGGGLRSIEGEYI